MKSANSLTNHCRNSKMKNREKFYIAGIIFLAFLALYFAFIHKQKIEVRFSKPVYPVGNFTMPDRQFPADQKL
jgi:hypothetical protein